jgi:hypothetical protein
MMTRRISYVMIIAGIFVLFQLAAAVDIPHQWTDLNGPYWAKGVDVAYGLGGDNQAWHRYLIGSDGNETDLYYWKETDPPWHKWNPLLGANNVISYKDLSGNGEKGFCTSLNDAVYWTLNGGTSWEPVPNSGFIPNKQFAALEIDEVFAGTKCFVGSMSMENEASAYQGELVSGNWQWNPVGSDGLTGKNIYDLEFPNTGGGYLVAGANDGIWRIQLDPPGQDWEPTAVQGVGVEVIEALDYHDAMWAATGPDLQGHRHLYFSPQDGPPWENYLEIQPGGAPFDKVVNDMAAIHLTGQEEYQSVYIATDDGLYLLDVVRTTELAQVRPGGYISFQEDNQYFQNSPFRFDNKVISVDYYQVGNYSLDRRILVGTTYNVYLITETRSGPERQIESITIEEAVTGTFISDIAKNNNAEN